MLYWLDSKGRYKKAVVLPHKSEYDLWRRNISDIDYEKVEDALADVFDVESKNIHTSGFIPGSDWTNTAYYPLYTACGNDKYKSGLFFGLIVYKYVMERDDNWGCTQIQINGREIESKTYYRLERSPVCEDA